MKTIVEKLCRFKKNFDIESLKNNYLSNLI